MKKISVLLICISIFSAFYSCQDDFCIDPTTPQLTIRFYDKDSVEDYTKTIEIIAYVEKDSTYIDEDSGNEVTVTYNDTIEDFNGTSALDSIYLPIDTQSTNVSYVFFDSIGGTAETLSIDYTTEDIYVSNACGYKSVFRDFTFEHTTDNWISTSEQLETEIVDQTQAHVKIYH